MCYHSVPKYNDRLYINFDTNGDHNSGQSSVNYVLYFVIIALPSDIVRHDLQTTVDHQSPVVLLPVDNNDR